MEEDGADTAAVGGNAGEVVERGGRWIHKVTANQLGGQEGHLNFTVIGYVVFDFREE